MAFSGKCDYNRNQAVSTVPGTGTLVPAKNLALAPLALLMTPNYCKLADPLPNTLDIAPFSSLEDIIMGLKNRK